MKRLALWSLLGLIAPLLAGCGGNDTEDLGTPCPPVWFHGFIKGPIRSVEGPLPGDPTSVMVLNVEADESICPGTSAPRARVNVTESTQMRRAVGGESVPATHADLQVGRVVEIRNAHETPTQPVLFTPDLIMLRP
ncbi:MAG: hypothetical protein KY468_05695 [Armatimonadetes bacterium]|nr:hypothetical protein [Armatimonadota bacterium]